MRSINFVYYEDVFSSDLPENPGVHHVSVDPVAVAVEKACQRGCIQVNEIIRKLEQNRYVALTASLSSAQKSSVLSELRSIMAVYG